MFKIIIIEDEEEIREELQILLRNVGYETVLISKFDHVVEQIEDIKGDLILLDVNLPNKDGYEICSRLRAISIIPIIFVTSKNNPMDELKGITLGADDYIEKPYNIPVLLARIASLLGRTYTKEKQEGTVKYKEIILDTLSGTVRYQKCEVELTRNEFKILYYLFTNVGKIVPRIDIVEYLWDNQMYIDDNTLSVNMSRIREKILTIGVEDLIETKRGQGYKV